MTQQRLRVATFEPAFHAHWERATVAEWLLVLAVVATPLAIGGVHLATRIALVGVVLVAFVWAAQRLAKDKRRIRVGLIGVGFGLALVITFLQFLPLPAGLVETLSPQSYAARVEVASALGAPIPEWMPLSFDQGRTAAAFVTLMAVTLAYLTATSLRSDSSAAARAIIAVEVAALAVLAVGALHELLGLHAIYGTYEASVDLGGVPFLTSFVNPNHAAALFLLGSMVALGASLSPERAQRWHLPVGVVLAVGVLVTMSRANALLLFAGLLVLTVPPLFLRRYREVRPRLWRLLIGSVCCLFVALVLIGPERWMAELASLPSTDFAEQGLVRECWRVGWALPSAAPIFGVGNGAFGIAATALTYDWNVGLIAYAHQGVLQTLADLGLPGGILVLLATGVGFVVTAVRGRRDLAVWGGVVGLGAVVVQNGVDFSLWIPGVGIPAAVVLGVVVQATWPEGARRSTQLAHPGWRWPLAASAVLVGLLVVTLPVAWRARPEAWQGEAQEALAAYAPQRIDLPAMVLQHPHDFLAMDLAAALAEQSGKHAEAATWAERALRLAPFEPMTLAATMRSRLLRGDVPGALELVERLDGQGSMGRAKVIPLVLETKAVPGGKALMEGYFAGDVQRSVEAANLLAQRGDGDAAEKLVAWTQAHHPDEPLAYEAYGARLGGDYARLAKLSSECLSKAGLASARPEDQALARRWLSLGYFFQGRVEAVAKRDLQAWNLFNAAAEQSDDVIGILGNNRVAALIEAGKAAQRLGRSDWLGETLGKLAGLRVEGAWPSGELHVLASQKAELDGDLPKAIREMQEALRFLGHVPDLHHRLADLFYRADDSTSGDRATERAKALEAAAHP
ncbi:MAG: O-antigen ligase family protein [Myxococcota bacterium]